MWHLPLLLLVSYDAKEAAERCARDGCTFLDIDPYPNDLADVLWRHFLLHGLHIAKLPLLSISFAIELLPFASLCRRNTNKLQCDVNSTTIRRVLVIA